VLVELKTLKANSRERRRLRRGTGSNKRKLPVGRDLIVASFAGSRARSSLTIAMRAVIFGDGYATAATRF